MAAATLNHWLLCGLHKDRVISPPFILDIYQCHVSHHITHLQAQPRGPRLNRNAELSPYCLRKDLKQILLKKKKKELNRQW